MSLIVAIFLPIGRERDGLYFNKRRKTEKEAQGRHSYSLTIREKTMAGKSSKSRSLPRSTDKALARGSCREAAFPMYIFSKCVFGIT